MISTDRSESSRGRALETGKTRSDPVAPATSPSLDNVFFEHAIVLVLNLLFLTIGTQLMEIIEIIESLKLYYENYESVVWVQWSPIRWSTSIVCSDELLGVERAHTTPVSWPF